MTATTPASLSQSSARRHFLKQVVRVGVAASIPAGAHVGIRAQVGAKIARFDHVAVPMRHTVEMVNFYRDLGFVVNEGDRICSVHFGDNKINFHRPEIWEGGEFTLRAPAAQPPCGDFCFVWEGSSAELTRALTDVNAEVVEGPSPRQGGRNGGVDTGTSRYIRDPDGNLLEFIIYS